MCYQSSWNTRQDKTFFKTFLVAQPALQQSVNEQAAVYSTHSQNTSSFHGHTQVFQSASGYSQASGYSVLNPTSACQVTSSANFQASVTSTPYFQAAVTSAPYQPIYANNPPYYGFQPPPTTTTHVFQTPQTSTGREYVGQQFKTPYIRKGKRIFKN